MKPQSALVHVTYAIWTSLKGLPAPLYVVEITVFPWKPKVKTEKGQHCPNLHPVYEDEEGKCYFRRQASLVQVNVLLIS